MNVNLACGNVYISDANWLNLDYVSTSSFVHKANLLGRLPLEDLSADIVYSSHFLEHIPRDLVQPFLLECWRVLKPGGVLRLVIPDLENLCRSYLYYRDNGEDNKADFVVMEMLDQFSRRKSGGELGRFYHDLMLNPLGNADTILLVQERTGEDLMQLSPPRRRRSLRSFLTRFPELVERFWILSIIQLLPAAFRDQNVSLASVGERHQWLYDFHSIKKILLGIGFISIKRCTASTSDFLDFPYHQLDLLEDGNPRKGTESLFVEARKP